MRVCISFFLLGVVFICGCATDSNTLRQHQKYQVAQGQFFLATSNAPAGAFYELGIYVIASGDTLSKIAAKFHVSVADIMTVNPGLQPFRLLVGQKIRIYERM